MVRRAFGPVALLAAAALSLGVLSAERWAAQPSASPPQATHLPASYASATSLPTWSAPPTRGPIPDGYRVSIPDLGIDLAIREGSFQRDIEQQATPEGFAFHLPGTSLPGEPGNTYLYSHARVGMFLPLWNAKPGQVVRITTPAGRTLVYSIAEVRPRVPPGDVSVAAETADERLTLQTSTGPSPSDPRFVAIAFPLRD